MAGRGGVGWYHSETDEDPLSSGQAHEGRRCTQAEVREIIWDTLGRMRTIRRETGASLHSD